MPPPSLRRKPDAFRSIGSRTVPSISWPVSGRLKSAFYSRRWMRTEVTHKGLDRSRIRLTGIAPQWPNLSPTLGYKLIVSGASSSGLFEGRFMQIRASVAAVSRAAGGHMGRRWSAGGRRQIGAAPVLPKDCVSLGRLIGAGRTPKFQVERRAMSVPKASLLAPEPVPAKPGPPRRNSLKFLK